MASKFVCAAIPTTSILLSLITVILIYKAPDTFALAIECEFFFFYTCCSLCLEWSSWRCVHEWLMILNRSQIKYHLFWGSFQITLFKIIKLSLSVILYYITYMIVLIIIISLWNYILNFYYTYIKDNYFHLSPTH